MGEIADALKARTKGKKSSILKKLIASEQSAQQEYRDAMKALWDDKEAFCQLSEIYCDECEHQDELEELLKGKDAD